MWRNGEGTFLVQKLVYGTLLYYSLTFSFYTPLLPFSYRINKYYVAYLWGKQNAYILSKALLLTFCVCICWWLIRVVSKIKLLKPVTFFFWSKLSILYFKKILYGWKTHSANNVSYFTSPSFKRALPLLLSNIKKMMSRVVIFDSYFQNILAPLLAHG